MPDNWRPHGHWLIAFWPEFCRGLWPGQRGRINRRFIHSALTAYNR